MKWDWTNDKGFLLLVVVIIVGCAGIVILGIDIATQSSGTGTIIGIHVILGPGNAPYYVAAISAPNANFTYEFACNTFQIGDHVQWTHDFIDGYLLQEIPPNCITY